MEELPRIFLEYRDILAWLMPSAAAIVLWWRIGHVSDAHLADLRTTIKETNETLGRLGDVIEAQTESIERARIEAAARGPTGGRRG